MGHSFLLSIRPADDLDGPPLFMTNDPRVVSAAVRALLGVLEERPDRPVLRLTCKPEPGPEEAP
jgi:hypothetical protein